ncbi:MAG: type I secretion system permease/ATPase, partial [Paracoccus sp. (in: a-proteobacteria)]
MTASACDPLILGLVELCRVHGVASSAERLTDGLLREKGEALKPSHAALALRRANMSCRITTEPLRQIPKDSLPVLLFLYDGGTVVLEAMHGKEASVILPATGGGRAIWSLQVLAQRHDGRILISKPIDLVSERLDER